MRGAAVRPYRRDMQTTTALAVRVLGTGDDASLRRWHEVSQTAETFERPWATTWTFDEMVLQVRAEDEAMRWTMLGAYDGDDMVGGAALMIPQLDNLDKVYGVVVVHPAHRRRGVGGRIVEEVVALMRSEGRSTLLVESGLPGEDRVDHPYARFARKHGFTMANVEVHRVLDLPLDPVSIRSMQAEAAAHHAGYEVRTFQDRVDEELIPSYVRLLNLLAVEAPTGDIDFEEEGMTPEVHRRHVERMLRQGRHKLVTLALDPHGEVVAHSDVLVPAGDRPKVYQWGTLVRRDHRGHHLGAAVKLANLLALQERFPDRTEIHTTNAEDNAAMVGINERLGFRVVEICPEFMLKL